MKFYDILQLDPQVNKNLMRKSTEGKEQFKHFSGMALRSVLIVLFAIVFISALTSLFGSENSPMAVAVFCILLGVRFVDFGCRIQDGILLLAMTFILLLISPVAANIAGPLPGFLINAVSLFLILFFTCDRPEFGNGGLFSFAYIYLSGNPVYGDAFLQRCWLSVTGFLICGLIYYSKHKDKHEDVCFLDTVRSFELTLFKHQWMLKMSLGISAVFLLGSVLGIERCMWAGFACGSLLSEYSLTPKIKQRMLQRIIGAAVGCLLFCMLFLMLPAEFHSLIGPLGGLCMGFCVDYKWKTAVNCLGALMIASNMYGLSYSVVLRLTDTLIGVVFAVCFFYMYERVFMEKARMAKRS